VRAAVYVCRSVVEGREARNLCGIEFGARAAVDGPGFEKAVERLQLWTALRLEFERLGLWTSLRPELERHRLRKV
jgi:hypothetical protein